MTLSWDGNNLAQVGIVQKNLTIHQVTTMVATSNNVLFPGHNQLLTTGTNDPTL